ncbi:MAG: hypothetical protein NWE89_07225 [Candidatus Bathyarchaeota archaeon]|nr:hypothetical protein [Candidatus Bathyarchaeota archaeon]
MDSKQRGPKLSKTKKPQYEVTVRLDRNLYNYLKFLENIKRVESKEEAIVAALRIFKKLNMQDWFPNVYRIGQERVIITTVGIMDDLFSTLNEEELYAVSQGIAMNRKALDVFDHELDPSLKDNWRVILNEMANFGWGKFTLKDNKIVAEQLALHPVFIQGYLESIFRVNFNATLDDDGTLTLEQ